MGETGMGLPHRITLNERQKLTMTGITEVISFEEDGVILKTALGTLLVQGKELRLKTLSPEQGQVELTGKISALSYEDPRQNSGWLRRFLK